MKIITVYMDKGGTGKSTISFNLAKWLAHEKNKKILMVDGDHSCNLSYSFSVTGKSSIENIFKKESVDIYEAEKNIDIIRGSKELEDDELGLITQQNNCMIMFMWIADNIDALKEYDYMIIDTHNDASLVTFNFLAVADIVLGVSEPSRNGFRAWIELGSTIEFLKKELFDVRTRESYVTAKPYLLGNKIEHIGNTSKQFLEVAEKEENYIGSIQKKELMAKSLLDDTGVFEKYSNMDEKERKLHKNFFENTEYVFNKIIEKANQ